MKYGLWNCSSNMWCGGGSDCHQEWYRPAYIKDLNTQLAIHDFLTEDINLAYRYCQHMSSIWINVAYEVREFL